MFKQFNKFYPYKILTQKISCILFLYYNHINNYKNAGKSTKFYYTDTNKILNRIMKII